MRERPPERDTDGSSAAGPASFVGFRGVSVTFANGVRALDDVTLDIARGTVLGVAGESGSGKTTLCRVLVGLQPTTAGSASIGGELQSRLIVTNPLAYRRRVQMLLQDAAASLSPRMSVRGLIAEPIRIHGLPPAETWARAEGVMERLGLSPELLLKYPHQLSGGEARRVAIVRALILRPELVIADEPTAGLDLSVRGELLNLMLELRAELGLTYLLVSHDLNVMRRVTDDMAVMYLGQVVEQATTRTLFAAPRHPYTAALLSARPAIDPAARQHRIVLSGEIPSPVDPPSGCRFHTRCPFVRGRCRAEVPALTVDESDPGGRAFRCHFPLAAADDPRLTAVRKDGQS